MNRLAAIAIFAVVFLFAAAAARAQVTPDTQGSIQLNLKVTDDAGIDAVSEIVQLQHVKAVELEPFVRSRLSRYGAVQVNDQLNALIITDKQPKLNDLVRMVKTLDIEGLDNFYRLVTDVIPLRHAQGDAFPALLAEVISPDGSVKFNKELNTLIITDLESKVELAKQIIAKLDHPVETAVIPVRYSRASTIYPLVSDKMSADGKISYQDDLNVLVVTDIKSKLDYLKEIIKSLDVPIPQILIEAKILEVSSEYLRSTGMDLPRLLERIDFELDRTKDRDVTNRDTDSDQKNVTTTTSTTTSGVTTTSSTTEQTQIINSDRGDNTDQSTKSSGWSSSLDVSRVDQMVNILKQRGNAKIIATPSIVVRNNKSGQVYAGSTAVAADSATEAGTAKIDLQVTPYTGSGNLVSMGVTLSTSSPIGWDGSGNLISSTQSLTSSVQISSGKTVIIGGLKTTAFSQQTRGVPVLERLPVLKKLFTKNEKRVSQNELVVFLTPTVLETEITEAEAVKTINEFEQTQADTLNAIPPKKIE